MIATELANALTSIGKPVCMAAADRLIAMTTITTAIDLHLRNAGLTATDAQALAVALLNCDGIVGPSLRSFSTSFNPDLGDAGAATLARALPRSVTELGLVGCAIGDTGGCAILEWAQDAPNLQMMCVEGNKFSAEMRAQFRNLSLSDESILVIV